VYVFAMLSLSLSESLTCHSKILSCSLMG